MARKLNVTATPTIITTEYKVFDTVHNTGVLVSSTEIEKFESEWLKDRLRIVRKVDYMACDVVGQTVVDNMEYGMTEETFFSIAREIPENGRRDLITRRKKRTMVKYSTFNQNTGKFEENNSMVIPAEVAKKSDAKILEYVKSEKEEAGLHVLEILDKVTDDKGALYGVEKETFIKNAVFTGYKEK